jgi:hypothetical protein
MSATLPRYDQLPSPTTLKALAMEPDKTTQADKKDAHKNYKGFVAGVFSGVSKLTGKSLAHLRSISHD